MNKKSPIKAWRVQRLKLGYYRMIGRICGKCSNADRGYCSYAGEIAQDFGCSKFQPSLPPILAVDFDGTLVDDRFPEIGPIKWDVWEAVESYRLLGYKIILWTCRDGDRLKDAVKFCADNGMVFDAVNRNTPEVIKLYNNDTRKVYADIYVDDKGVGLCLNTSTLGGVK